MKMLSAILIGTLCALPLAVAAQSTEPQPDQAATNEAAEARQILEQVARAYREAPGLKDEVVLTRVAAGRTWSGELAADFRGGNAEVRYDSLVARAVGDTVFITRMDVANKYVQHPLTDNLFKTLPMIPNGGQIPLPHLQWRSSAADANPADALNLTMPIGLKPVSHETAEQDGQEMILVNLKGLNAKAVARIDAETKLLHHLEIKQNLYGAVDAAAEVFTLQCSPQIVQAPEPMRFDTTERRQVESLADLVPLGVGDTMSSVQFKGLDGTKIALDDYRGSVVVLDFWATWCGPCRAAMPALNDFAKQAGEDGTPVVVLAVNVWESQRAGANETEAERIARVQEFWNGFDFVFKPVIDVDDSTIGKLGLRSIPSTVIVGPDGVIRATNSGFPGPEAYLQSLRKETHEALKVAG